MGFSLGAVGVGTAKSALSAALAVTKLASQLFTMVFR
jgi:hypothetical protein